MTEIRQIKGKSSEDYEELLDRMFESSDSPQTLIVDLPSKCKFYRNASEVTINPLTFEDEAKILNSKGKGNDIINMILENCVRGINVPDLLQIDKLFLLMKVREASYGAVYKFSLDVTYVSDDFEDTRPVMLPKIGVEALVRFPRNSEEIYFSNPETLAKNLYKFVIAIDEREDPVFISKAIKRMHIVDVKTIANEVTKGEFGLDPRFLFECPSCDHKTMMEIPLDAAFFSVT
jgi:hypothetical protein